MTIWTNIRDRIALGPQTNDLIAAEMAAGNIADGDTLVFLAREIRQDTTWVVPDGHPVVVAADSYVTSGTWSPFGTPTAPTMGIDARGSAGRAGDRGAPGRDGTRLASGSTPGEAGGPGGVGTPGTAGRGIAVLARQLFPVMLHAAGGAGGAGGIGGRGGDGARSRIIMRPSEPIEIEGSNGGPGGPGGTGGAGGAGADVTVVYVSSPAVQIAVTGGANGFAGSPAAGNGGTAALAPIPLVFDPAWVRGGVGGTGGPGGSPGASFLEPPWPAAGADGATGLAGTDGALAVQQVDDPGYWSRVRATLPVDVREAWARYRLAVGVFCYRSFIPNDPERGGLLVVAYGELQAAAELGSAETAAAATAQLQDIGAGLNGIGLPRCLAVKADFDSFQETYVQDAPLLAPMFLNAQTMIANAVAMRAVDGELRTAASAVSNTLTPLELDVRAAEAAGAGAQVETNELNRQLSEVQAEIGRARGELTEATMELEGAGQESLAIGIFNLIGNLIPAVKAASGIVGVLVRTNNDPSLRRLLGTDDRSTPVGGLAFALDETALLWWGYGKSQADIAAARISANEAAIKSLLGRLVTVVFQLKRQQLESAEADRRIAAAHARVTAAAADAAALQAQIGADVADLRLIATLVERQIDSIGRLGAQVVRNVFLAARALDVWDFSDSTGAGPWSSHADRLPLDFGLVHPDVVADAVQELRRGGLGPDRAVRAAAALRLVDELARSWAQAPRWEGLRSRANELVNGLSRATTWVAITAPAALDSMRQSARMAFSIGLDDLPPDARELRIRTIHLVLVGAAKVGGAPSVVGRITHGGPALVRLSSGSEQLVDGSAQTSLVDVALTTTLAPPAPVGSPGISGADVSAVVGRSPATQWQLDLRGAVSQGLDVTGVTAVQMVIEFFAVPATTTSPGPGAPLELVATGMTS